MKEQDWQQLKKEWTKFIDNKLYAIRENICICTRNTFTATSSIVQIHAFYGRQDEEMIE